VGVVFFPSFKVDKNGSISKYGQTEIEIQKLDNMKKEQAIFNYFRMSWVLFRKSLIFVRSLLKEIPQFCGEKTEMN